MSNVKQDGNQSTPKHKLDTADFLAFSDNQASEFCPSNTSSPQKYWKQASRSSYQKSWNNRRCSENFRGHFYSSPTENPRNRSFNGPYDNVAYKWNSSPNHSFNSSFSSFRSRKDYSYFSPKNTNEGGINILSYLHPSFMEDPWAKLEKQTLQQTHRCIEPEVSNDSSSGSDEVPVET